MGQGGKPSFTEERQVNKSGINPRNRKLLFYIFNRITVSGKDHGSQGVKEGRGADCLASTKYQFTF